MAGQAARSERVILVFGEEVSMGEDFDEAMRERCMRLDRDLRTRRLVTRLTGKR